MDSKTLVENNLNFYESIKPKNPKNSYTVLASLNDYNTGELIVLSTGTQVCNRIYEDDIEDCHAESLLKRAFKRYLLENDDLYFNSRTLIDRDCGRISTQVKSQHEYTLFISQFPCGLVKRYEGPDIRDKSTGHVIKRKPGRGKYVDGNRIIYSEKDCCLDKIKRWLSCGLQGLRFAKGFGAFEFNIRQILIGQCEPDQHLDYNNYIPLLKEYLTNDSTSGRPIPHVQLVEFHREEFIFSCEKQPQPVSLVWWRQSHKKLTAKATGEYRSVELVVNGRKHGLTKKQSLDMNENVKLRISSSMLNKDLDKLLNC